MKQTERFVRHYIRAVGLKAVYLAKSGRRIRIGMTGDPDDRSRGLKRVGATMQAVYWLQGGEQARALIRAAGDAIPGIDEGGANIRVQRVKSILENLAANARLPFTDDASVQKRAAAIVDEIERRVEAMQASGHLRGLNAAYRDGRAEAATRGVSFPSYGEYLARYKIKMLYEVARLAQ